MKLDESNFESETKSGVVLVDFYADWCGPCRQLTPVLEELQNVKVVKVDVDKSQTLARQYDVSAIPKLVFLKDGVQMESITGVQSKKSIQAVIDRLQ